MELTRQHVLDFLKTQKLMSVATYGDFPWSASVYYTFDNDLNLYFLSNPATLHCKFIGQNPLVAVSIAGSNQNIAKPKKGLQISGIAEQISDAAKIVHALKMWKDFLGVVDSELSYENMVASAIKGRMYRITPKRIKLFDQELFKDADDGEEPVLEL